MRQGNYRQFEQDPRPSQFRNLRSSDFYDAGRQREFTSPRRQDYMTTPSYSVHELDHDGYPESRMIEIDRGEHITRREQYHSPRSRTNHLGHTASLSNISRPRLNEEEDSRYATLPAEAMKKDSSRNIEINLNFEKGKVNLDEQLDKVTEYDMVIRSYEKDRMKWDTDRKAFKNELNYQQTQIEKLQDLVMALRGKICDQEQVTNELLSSSEKQRRMSSGSGDADQRELRAVRSLTKINTARDARDSLRESFGEEQRNQLRDIEQKTKQLKEMERQERMTAEQLMAIVRRLREQNTNYRRLNYEMQKHPPRNHHPTISSESQTDLSPRRSESPRKSEDRFEANVIKEQNQRLLRDAERLNGEVNTLLNENNRLSRENVRLRTEMSDMRTNHKAETEKLNVDINNLADMLVEKEMENDQLSNYREQVGELTRLNDQLNQSIKEMSQLPNQSDETSVVEELKREIEELMREISNLEAQKMSVIKSARELNESNQRLKETNEQIEIAYENVERELKESSLRLEIATMSLEQFKRQNLELKQQLDEKNRQITEKSSHQVEPKEYQESKQKVNELSEEISRLQKQLKMVGSELQLSNSLSLELKLLNETLQMQLNSQDRVSSEEKQIRQFICLSDEIEKIKEEISRIQNDHKQDLAEKTARIKQLQDDLRHSNERLELLQSEKDKAHTEVRSMTLELGDSRNELLQLRQTLVRAQRDSEIQTEKRRTEDEDNLLHLTEQLEKSLGDLDHMKSTMLSMQTEIESLRKDSNSLAEEKCKLEVALADGATKHERELKCMLTTNEQIVRNLLEIAQRNYELETEIEQMKAGDNESFLKVESNVKEAENSSEELKEESFKARKPEPAMNLEKIAEESDEESNSFRAVSKVKSLLCDMENMFQEDGSMTHSGQLLDSIDKLEKMMAVRSRLPRPGSFTKKEPFYDNEISGFSVVEEKKTDSFNRISETSYHMEEKEKLARLGDSKMLFETKLEEALKESQLSPEDNLTVILYGFLRKLYQYPNPNFFFEEIHKLFMEVKAYEADVQQKLKAMELAVHSYLDKANNVADRLAARSEDVLPTSVPSVSEFRCSPSEEPEHRQHPILSAILEENRQESTYSETKRQVQPALSQQRPDDDLLSFDQEVAVPVRREIIRTPSRIDPYIPSPKKEPQIESSSKISKSSSKSMTNQRLTGHRSPGLKKSSTVAINIDHEFEQPRGKESKESMSMKSTPSAQLPNSPKNSVTNKREVDQKTKPKAVVSTPTPNKRPLPKK